MEVNWQGINILTIFQPANFLPCIYALDGGAAFTRLVRSWVRQERTTRASAVRVLSSHGREQAYRQQCPSHEFEPLMACWSLKRSVGRSLSFRSSSRSSTGSFS